MTKYINLTIAYLIFAATIVKELLSLTYIFTKQPIALFLNDLFTRLKLGKKGPYLNINKSCYYTFSNSGIGKKEQNLAMEELTINKGARPKILLVYNI